MDRRSFLGLGLKAAVLGAALSSGLAVTRLRQVGEYAVMYRYTDRSFNLYEDQIPTEIKEQAFQRMGLIAEYLQGSIIECRPVHMPPGPYDMSDPIGKYGQYGLVFNLEYA